MTTNKPTMEIQVVCKKCNHTILEYMKWFVLKLWCEYCDEFKRLNQVRYK